MRPIPWEYRLEQTSDLTEAKLNAIGRDGWELATIDPIADRAIFKRPGPDYRERITLAQRERVKAGTKGVTDEA